MTAVCITGMHRSGTSMVARLLNLSGVYLGEKKDISAIGFDNPEGFWENAKFISLNDRILERLQSGWDFPPIIAPDWNSGQLNDLCLEAENIVSSFKGHAIWGWKDPRNSLLFPFWENILPNMKVILCLRNPLEVALSLNKRNNFSIHAGLNLWYVYNSQLINSVKKEDLLITHYSSFFLNPDRELERLLSFLGIKTNEEKIQTTILKVIPALHHQQYSLDDALAKNTPQEIVDLYVKLCLQSGKVYWLGFEKEHSPQIVGISEYHNLLVRLKEQKRKNQVLEIKNKNIESQYKEIENRYQILVSEARALREFIVTVQSQNTQLVDNLQKIQSLNIENEKTLFETRNQTEKTQTKIKEIWLKIDLISKSLSWNIFIAFQKNYTHFFPPFSLQERFARKVTTIFFNMLNIRNLRLIRNSNLFDKEYYLTNNPDVSKARKDPVWHYLQYGAFENRNPSSSFSSKWYLEEYVDVRILGINPLVHYLKYGKKEGRLPSDPSLSAHIEKQHPQLSTHQLSQLQKIYKNIYKSIGLGLRNHFPSKWVEFIKQFLPNPEGIPQYLTYTPPLVSSKTLPVDAFSTPNPETQPDIFIFSIIDWAFRHQRPQHIAEGLAKTGRRVFYIEQMLSGHNLEISKLDENLFKVRLSGEHSGHIQPYSGQPTNEKIRHWIKALYELCDAVHATAFKQIIIQHPFWWQMVKHLPPEFEVVYDCMDDIAEFSNTESFILDLEHDLLKNCDKLVVSSQHLFEKYKNVKSPTLIRNATDVEHFSDLQKESINFTLKQISVSNDKAKKIKVGYVGAISDWFDTVLIETASKLDLNIEYHLCGAVTSPQAAQLEKLPNIRMYGEIKYTDVPDFLCQMDVAIIPFQIVPIIQACDPVKFYEYSALGIPTITTPLPELQRVSDITLVASSPEEFLAQIRKGVELSKDDSFRKKLRQYAMENTWADRVNQFNKILGIFPKVSVIILSYENPQLTIDTISSLYYQGKTYPDLEILVIDNGSKLENINQIKQYAENFHEINIIENGENLGFAKGNNIGMKYAKGDYVMLLNNDTLVAPGAIYAMVRHLQNNPKVGVVSTLTNNIGNEAKVFVEYEGIEEMKHVARELTIGYRGQYTELNVVAYFAAMFRQSDLNIFGYLSEDYGLGMFEDDDHCAVIRSYGYKCLLAEDAYIHHHLSASFSINKDKKKLFEKNKSIFEKKWGRWSSHQYRKQRRPSLLENIP